MRAFLVITRQIVTFFCIVIIGGCAFFIGVYNCFLIVFFIMIVVIGYIVFSSDCVGGCYVMLDGVFVDCVGCYDRGID
jgi:hypothetical protein